MLATERRYDIDWLRVIAIGLLLIYHIAIIFQPWAALISFIQSNESLLQLWIPMAMLNVWRIPLLFFVSGMGVAFAIRKRNWKQLILERSKRIMLPYLVGFILIVPIHILIWQNYYKQDLSYVPHPSHLWFLANIFIYVLVLSPAFFYLKRNENGKLVNWMKHIFKTPIGLLLITIPFVLEAYLLKPEPYELYASTLHGFLLGLLAFFFGFCFIVSGKTFWDTVLKWKWLFLVIAVSLFIIRWLVFELKSPNYLMPIESNCWIFALFGLASKYLNKNSKSLIYLSQAAYPIYIIHMVFLYLGAVLILPLDISISFKFILVIGFTCISCFILYEFIIKRVSFLKPLFGLKSKQKVRTIFKAKPAKIYS